MASVRKYQSKRLAIEGAFFALISPALSGWRRTINIGQTALCRPNTQDSPFQATNSNRFLIWPGDELALSAVALAEVLSRSHCRCYSTKKARLSGAGFICNLITLSNHPSSRSWLQRERKMADTALLDVGFIYLIAPTACLLVELGAGDATFFIIS